MVFMTDGQDRSLASTPAAVASTAKLSLFSPLACASEPAPEPEELGRIVCSRFAREGRWQQIQPVRDQMMREARKIKMTKVAARVWVYSELDRLYPPLPPPPELELKPVESEPIPEPETETQDPSPEPIASSPPPADPQQADIPPASLSGLGTIPVGWGDLSDNAQLVDELAWVQSQRLRVVEERGNRTIVYLDRATRPAPSMAALGWLETSIRNYAKYCDLVAKVAAQPQTEAEDVRKERMALHEIEELLAEMLEFEDVDGGTE